MRRPRVTWDRADILADVALSHVSLRAFRSPTPTDFQLSLRREGMAGPIVGASVRDPPHGLLIALRGDTLIRRQAPRTARDEELNDTGIQRIPSRALLPGHSTALEQYERGGVAGALDRTSIAVPEAQGMHRASARLHVFSSPEIIV